jgi:hypothetical protein
MMIRPLLPAILLAGLLVAGSVSHSQSSTSSVGGNQGAEPRCQSSALQLAVGDRISEATGQHSLSLTLTNQSSTPCYLFGYPKLTLLDSSGGELPFDYRTGGDQMVTSHPPTRVVVSPGRFAYVTINKYRCDVGDRGMPTTVQLIPPGDTLPLQLALPPSALDLGYCGPSDPGTLVSVSPVGSTFPDTVAHQ